MDYSRPGSPVLPYLGSLLRFMSIELMMLFNHLILCFPFSSCSQSFPASGSFPMSQLFSSGGQSIGASGSASVLAMNIQGWFPLGLTGLASFQSKRLSRVFYSTTTWKYQFFGTQPSYGPALTSVHDYWKNHSFGISKHLVSPSASGKMSIYLE